MTLYRGATCKADICSAESVSVYSQEGLDKALEDGFVDYFTAISGATVAPVLETVVTPKRRGRPPKEQK
jgi:hypothetical protein